MAEIDLPTTDAAVTARQILEEHAETHLVEHCLRTYYWARVLSHRDGLRQDDEVLFVASLLHDLGLTPSYASPKPERGCFTVPASDTAARLARDSAWSDDRTRAVAEAITLHLNPRVTVQQGVEAHLVAAGASCDVIGMRAHQISEETRAEVLSAHPRHGLKERLVDDLRTYGDARRTRAHLLLTAGQFERRTRRAPYEE